MQRFEPEQEIASQLAQRPQRQRTTEVLRQLEQRQPVDALHRDEHRRTRRPDLVHLRQVRALQAHAELGLVPKSQNLLLILRELLLQYLDDEDLRPLGVRLGEAREMDLADTALTGSLQELISPEAPRS